MKKQIFLFDDDKNIRISLLDNEYDNKFEITDSNMQHTYFTKEQLEELKEMIVEMLQTVNKQDW